LVLPLIKNPDAEQKLRGRWKKLRASSALRQVGEASGKFCGRVINEQGGASSVVAPGSEQSLLPFLLHLVDRADSALSFVGLNCCAGISCLLVLGATNCGKRLFRCQESHVCRIFPLHDILPAVHTVLFLVLRKQHCRRIFSHKRPPNPWDMLGAVGVAPSSASARPRKVWPEVFCAKAVSSGKVRLSEKSRL